MVICHKWAADAMVACRNLVDMKVSGGLAPLSTEEAARFKADEKILRLVVGSWVTHLEITELTKLEADVAIKRWLRRDLIAYQPESQRIKARA